MMRAKQLSRTIALYKTDLGIADDHVIEAALRRFNVLLAIGHPASSTRAGQCSILTAAMLLARSGHNVFVQATDGPMVGHQPPFEGSSLHEAVQSVQGQLIDGSSIRLGAPDRIDIAFEFGTASSIAPYQCQRTVSVGWSAWSGEISDWPPSAAVTEFDWPIGAMAASVMVAAEVSKMVVRSLAQLSTDPGETLKRFAKSDHARLILVDENTPKLAAVGDFTSISAGAVTNGLFYSLARLPDLFGRASVYDNDPTDQSNLNRNMMLLQSLLPLSKVELLEHFGHGLKVFPVPRLFGEADLEGIGGRVTVGVDHVPSRWLLARGRYDWMSIGATEHFNVLNSYHYPFSGCPACLHPYDEAGPEITPTIAHVSFLSGLLQAAHLVAEVAGAKASLQSVQRYLFTTAFGRNSAEVQSGVHVRRDCPACCPASQARWTG